MKTVQLMTVYLSLMILPLCVPPVSDAARGCDDQDEKQWVKMRDQLPTSDLINISILIYDLTKLKDKCDPKTRFSASVVRLLIQANFRQEELRGALKRIQDYTNTYPGQSPVYDPGGLPTRTGP